MPLGVISRVSIFCFEILVIFEKKKKKNRKKKQTGNLGIGPLHRSLGNPHRGVALHHNVGYLTAARPRCQNGTPPPLPSGTLRSSLATPQRRHNSLRENFQIFVSKHLVFVHR